MSTAPCIAFQNTVSVIIPSLNEEESLPLLLDCLLRIQHSADSGASDAAHFCEVIVVDGGSTDKTVEIARAANIEVVAVEREARGRGAQMRAGAERASGYALFFLHADSLPPLDAPQQIITALKDSRVVGGNFSVRFDPANRAARFLTWLYPHLRRIGLRYGDSGIFVRRSDYETVGGFRPHPIFEDLDLLRRLRHRGGIVNLQGILTASSRRFHGRSFALTFARWATMQILYWAGVSPQRLVRLYAPIRSQKK